MFEAALNRRFPEGQATFSQVMNNLEISYKDFSQEPKKFPTSEAIVATFSGFAGANCRENAIIAIDYSCYVYFKEDVKCSRFTFERDTDTLFDIGVGHTGT